jgi:hypothetical protein
LRKTRQLGVEPTTAVIVIASKAKQSRSHKARTGLLRRFAPRNDNKNGVILRSRALARRLEESAARTVAVFFEARREERRAPQDDDTALGGALR